MALALVTGATGFIGSHLVQALLARGDDVRCLVRDTSRRGFLEKLPVRFVTGDVTGPETLDSAVSGVDVVYNLAGLTSALRAEDQQRVNGHGVENVARACAEQETPPVHVLVSSVAAAGPAPRSRLRVESEPPRPVSNYGRSKREGELAASRWASRVPTTIVRPGAVFGERDRLMFPMFQSVARFHVHAAAGLFPPKLSVIYAGDLAQLLISAADGGERVTAQDDQGTGYYFACVPEYPDLMQFGRLLARALETRFVVFVPLVFPLPWCVGGVSQLGGRLVGRAPALTIDKVREATAPSWACSCEKATHQLGFAPAETLEDRLRQTAHWYREQKWL